MKKWFVFTIVILLLVISWLPYNLALSSQPETGDGVHAPPQMSDHISVWSDAVDNDEPAVVYNPLRQEYLVVWMTKQDNFTWDIWGRRVRADGSLPQGGWFNIDSTAGVKLASPEVAYNPDLDQYLVVYTQQLSTVDYDIWGRVIDWNGAPHNRLYLDTAPLIQDDPVVVYNTQNHFYLLAYHSEQPGGEYNLELRSLGMDGGFLDARNIPSPPGEYRLDPSLVYNPNMNNFLLVYGIESTLGPPKVVGRTLSPDLIQISPEFEYSDPNNWGVEPHAALGRNEYLVTWYKYLSDGHIAARRLNMEAMPLGPSQGIMIASGPGMISRSHPKVRRAGLFGYLVTWNYFDMQTADVGDVYGRYVGFGQDQPLDENFAIDTRINYQGRANLACAHTGTCMVVNTHNPSAYPAGDYEISARLIFMTQVYLPLAMR